MSGKGDPVGSIATPYGLRIPVYRWEGSGQSDDDGALDLEGSAALFGIWPESRRKEFAAEARRLMDMGPETGLNVEPLLERFGGICPVVRVPLGAPHRSVFNDVAIGQEVADDWANLLSEAEDWHSRAETLMQIIEGQAQHWRADSMPDRIVAGGICGMMTAALELLGTTEIDSIEAGAFYGISVHANWRETARLWLMPHRRTWFHDWIMARPGYRKLAKHLRGLLPDIPRWMHA